jgi:2-dehydropantoate 2-reductase
VSGASDTTRILVLGTGAIGSLIAARLARAGAANVTVAGTWTEALETIRRDGITVKDDTGRWSARVATARLSEVGQADYVLVLVKSAQTAAVAETAARALAPGGMVVTLQNGLGNGEVLAAAAGADRVAIGVTTLAATLLGPGRVRASPGAIVIGAANPRPLARLVQALRAGGMETETMPDIGRLVWRKLAASCTINPVAALLGVANGVLVSSAEGRDRLAAAAREVGAVAAAKGIDLQEDPVAIALTVASRTAGNRCSMLQDLDRGAPTEIDALCGAIVAEGRAVGVPTPVNAALWHEVHEREARLRATQGQAPAR